MDGLSAAASVIAVLQAANCVISVCYDFRAALKHQPWALTRCLDETTELRTVLERLERFSRNSTTSGVPSANKDGRLELLCDSQKGPLTFCSRELARLQELFDGSGSSDRPASRRRAFNQAVEWRLRDHEVKTCLARLERCKATLSLALDCEET